MGAKLPAIVAQATMAVIAWWATRTDDERRRIQARTWQELEKLAMNFAKNSSTLAAYAERRRKDVLSGVI
jgi:hypothetical protein